MGKYAPRTPKERTIYSNYDLWENYPDDYIKDSLKEHGYEDDEITEELMMEERYFYDEMDWQDTKCSLEEFFSKDGDSWIAVGQIGLWHGVYPAGIVFEEFDKFFYEAVKDCAYWHLYDENGHFYLRCTHHDGSNLFEIRRITDQGIKFLERWEDNWDDKRSEAYIHTQIMKRYSRLPHYAKQVFGCKRFEYEPITKSVLINRFNKQAKSFYCSEMM